MQERKPVEKSGMELVQEGHNFLSSNYDGAILKYNAALKKEPSPEVYYQVGCGLFSLGRYAAAMVAAGKASGSSKVNAALVSKLYADSQNHLNAYGNWLYKGTIPTPLCADVSLIIQMCNNTQFEEYWRASQVIEHAKQHQAAYKLLCFLEEKETLLKNVVDAHALVQEAHAVLSSDPDAAILKYELALEKLPNNRDIIFHTACGLFQLGRYAACMVALTDASSFSSANDKTTSQQIQDLYATAQLHLSEYRVSKRRGILNTRYCNDMTRIHQMCSNTSFPEKSNKRKSKKKLAQALLPFKIVAPIALCVFGGPALVGQLGKVVGSVVTGMGSSALASVGDKDFFENIIKGGITAGFGSALHSALPFSASLKTMTVACATTTLAAAMNDNLNQLPQQLVGAAVNQICFPGSENTSFTSAGLAKEVIYAGLRATVDSVTKGSQRDLLPNIAIAGVQQCLKTQFHRFSNESKLESVKEEKIPIFDIRHAKKNHSKFIKTLPQDIQVDDNFSSERNHLATGVRRTTTRGILKSLDSKCPGFSRYISSKLTVFDSMRNFVDRIEIGYRKKIANHQNLICSSLATTSQAAVNIVGVPVLSGVVGTVSASTGGMGVVVAPSTWLAGTSLLSFVGQKTGDLTHRACRGFFQPTKWDPELHYLKDNFHPW